MFPLDRQHSPRLFGRAGWLSRERLQVILLEIWLDRTPTNEGFEEIVASLSSVKRTSHNGSSKDALKMVNLELATMIL